MADALSPTMTLRDFENGYWYLEQLRTSPSASVSRREEAAEGRTRKGDRGVPAHRQGCIAHEAFTAGKTGVEGRGKRGLKPEAPNFEEKKKTFTREKAKNHPGKNEGGNFFFQFGREKKPGGGPPNSGGIGGRGRFV